ncbi:hypothetical protein B0H15DRAFT_408140 [Mycena belliarum]|uniref:F-box domain-containing protein n=1 Tax=Mycena belliarum TaxID=1033014 RepID=A0AAD6UM03_9AGAR|nr:hypothetical protein B0H15DRAFT_408140 [Mycena belliae]
MIHPYNGVSSMNGSTRNDNGCYHFTTTASAGKHTEETQTSMSPQPLKHQLGAPVIRPMVDLPDEILLDIFRSALPPSWMMHWAKASPPFPLMWSADMPTKLAIISVCRAWNRVGIEFLYESVVIRQIGQLPAFVHALETREGLGALVRHFDTSCFRPPGYYDMHDAEIRKVFALCGNLAHFAYGPQFTGSLPPFDRLSFVLPSNVTTLELGSLTNYPSILPSLAHLSSTLISLSLTIVASEPFDHTIELVFPRLENLRIGFSIAYSVVHPELILHWLMPALRCLVWHDHYRTDSQALPEFIKAGGQRLTSIDIVYIPRQFYQAIPAILAYCPILEHIAVSYEVYFDLLGSSHPTLASLDVFVDNTVHWPTDIFNDPLIVRQTVYLNPQSFPSLRICRFLRGSSVLNELRYTPAPALPTSADGTISLESTSLNNRATSDFPLFSWLPVFLSHESESDEDSDEDPDYVPASEDDGGSVVDSESGSDSDAISVSDNEEGNGAVDGEISAEEALEMYRSRYKLL